MSEFKTGDRIAIADVDDGNERVFLAEYSGKSYYVNTDTGAAYPVQTRNVSAYVPPAQPFTFKVGDRLRRSAGTQEYVLVAVENDHAHLVRLRDGELQHTVYPTVLVSGAWELAEATPVADTCTHEGIVYDLNAAYRDCDGDVWRFTDRRTDSGVPWMSCVEGPTKEPLDGVVVVWGPLTKV